jgi:hypothetical protein
MPSRSPISPAVMGPDSSNSRTIAPRVWRSVLDVTAFAAPVLDVADTAAPVLDVTAFAAPASGRNFTTLL